jgi:tetratricopeptide (TPR) repeat protein
MVPREALFLAMQGDIYRQDDRLRNAVGSYEESIRANPGLFYGYLRKGQVEYELGRTREAENALERSLGLLPTAEAHFLLGKIDQSRGDERAAAEHFAQASESQSRAGQAAQEELVRLDLATNTSRYVATQLVQDDNGYVWVQFGNRSRVPIENIQLTYIWVDANGRTLQDSVVYRGPLAAGNQDRVRLDVRLPANTSLSSRIRVQATGGAVVNT